MDSGDVFGMCFMELKFDIFKSNVFLVGFHLFYRKEIKNLFVENFNALVNKVKDDEGLCFR